MKKNTLLFLALLLANLVTRAQSGNKITLSLGPEFTIPINTNSYDYGKIRDFYKDGIGGSFRAEFPLTSTLHFIASAGFLDYASNAQLIVPDITLYPTYIYNQKQSTHYQFIPVKAGLQYYFAKCLYINGEAGAAIKLNYSSENSFIYSGGLGGVIPLSLQSGLDIGFRYERGYKIPYYPQAMSQIGIRVAYKYNF
jgi:hypothetical protein